MYALLLAAMIGPWGNGVCSVEQLAPLPYHWDKYNDNEYHLYKGNAQVAGYRVDPEQFRWLDHTGEWRVPVPPPWSEIPPIPGLTRPKPIQATVPNFGVDLSRISKEEVICLSGQRATKEQVYQAIADKSLSDDSKKGHLTIIGSPDERKKVLADLDSDPALKDLKTDFHVQAYDPTDWTVRDTGFVTTGTPTIYCQDAAGKVLFRKDAYAGPSSLAEELRILRPDYDPKKDRPSLIDLSPKFNFNINPWWIVAGLVLLYLFTGPRKAT